VKKYRAGKIKREHTVIEDVWPLLEQIAAGETITSIIPGPISPLRGRGLELTFQRFTETGLRLLAKNGSAIQEIYLVAPEKEAALKWLGDAGLVAPVKEVSQPPVAASNAEPHKKAEIPSDQPCTVCGRLITAGTRAIQQGHRHYQYAHVRCMK
jgi:hypothetical protein